MIVLGLDPGTAATGFGVVQVASGRLRALAHGVVRTPAGEQPALRLAAIHERVRELAAAHVPDAAAVEDLFVRENPRTILSVGEARGAALAALGSLGVPVHTYTAPTIKSAVCGYGKAEKAQVQQMVRAILALAELPRPNHAADALAAAICHAQTWRPPRAALATSARSRW
jgi:crossover junction endodeoxyribonuclease RuvC